MALNDMLEAAREGGTVEVEAGWDQGRAVFGGLVGALLLSGIRGQVTTEAGPLRVLTTTFVAPLAAGPAEIRAEVLRRGRNVTVGRADVVQGGAVAATATAAFGLTRDSVVVVDPAHPMPDLGEAEAVDRLPYVEDLMPTFFQHVDLRPVTGAMPFSGADHAELSGWTGLDDSTQVPTEETLTLLADAWPPSVLQMLPEPAAASSLTWTLEFLADPASASPGRHWAYRAYADATADGYAHTRARLWAEDGTPVALSSQTVTVFG